MPESGATDDLDHPTQEQLERFMRSDLEGTERRRIIRHLIAGCARCATITRGLWSLGDAAAAHTAPGPGETPTRSATRGTAAAAPAAHPADLEQRIERERQDAPRWVEKLLASPPERRAAMLVAGATPPLSPAVCELLLARARGSRTAFGAAARSLRFARAAGARGDLATASTAAELARAVADRLDPALCGATVVRGLQARSWGHLGQVRRLAGDLTGAGWAFAMAEMVATAGAGVPAGAAAPPPALEPGEWAELLAFEAALVADRGDLGDADRLLTRACEIYLAAGDRRRAAHLLLQQSSLRADLHDAAGAVERVRSAVALFETLPRAGEPWLLAESLCQLGARLLATVRPAAGAGRFPAAAQASDADEPAAPGIVFFPTLAAVPAASAPAAPAPPAAAHLAGGSSAANKALGEALRAVDRGRRLFRDLDDAAGEARALRLLGQIQAALDLLADAEATLWSAAAALARQGLGREAALAQVELGRVLARRGRAAEMGRFGLDHRAPLFPRDASWEWASALLVFQSQVRTAPHDTATLDALAHYLAAAPRRREPRLAQIA